MAQQSLLNERYQQGAEMLGSDVLTVRLGGIYALQRLAEEHPEQYHIQIMQLFCAFARHPTRDERETAEAGSTALEPGGKGGQTNSRTQLRQDMQAVISAISACHARQLELERNAEYRLDLQHAQLTHADLNRANLSSGDLSDANLSGSIGLSTDLSFAKLVNANVSRATLFDTDLSRADLWCANLSRASLWKVNLSGTQLLGADMSDAGIRQANLSEAKLSGANLSGAQLSMSNGQSPATGLTQAQLDLARANPDNPPKLDGVVDAETGEPLVWRGKPLNDGE